MNNIKNIDLKNLYNNYLCCSEENPYYIPGALQFVPGYGNYNSNTVIIGEAPGSEEEITGKPFQGRSGKLLRATLAKYNFDDKNIFVTNVVKFRPPQNRKPNKNEILLHMSILLEELNIIKPKFIILVGSTALSLYQAEISESISRVRGGVYFDKVRNCTYFPIYHPSYILRNINLMNIFEKDIAQIAKYISSSVGL